MKFFERRERQPSFSRLVGEKKFKVDRIATYKNMLVDRMKPDDLSGAAAYYGRLQSGVPFNGQKWNRKAIRRQTDILEEIQNRVPNPSEIGEVPSAKEIMLKKYGRDLRKSGRRR